MKALLKTCVDVVSRRKRLLAVLNLLFFWTIFVAALATSFLITPPPYEGMVSETSHTPFRDSGSLMVLSIFLSNLILSAFIMVTLLGLVFFILSPALLLLRAVVWSELLAFAPTPQFIIALPTLILEAEAYVLAAVSGIVFGLSWLKPAWIYKSEGLSRREALKVAFKEALHVYFLVAVILFFAAVVETATLLLTTA